MCSAFLRSVSELAAVSNLFRCGINANRFLCDTVESDSLLNYSVFSGANLIMYILRKPSDSTFSFRPQRPRDPRLFVTPRVRASRRPYAAPLHNTLLHCYASFMKRPFLRINSSIVKISRLTFLSKIRILVCPTILSTLLQTRNIP